MNGITNVQLARYEEPLSRLAEQLCQAPPSRVLFVRLSALGDVVHCLPALDALAELWPQARFDWVTESLSAGLLEGHPHLERVLELPRKSWSKRQRRLGQWPAIAAEMGSFRGLLRAERYDLVLDFQGNLRSTVLCANVRGGRRIMHHASEVKSQELPWLVPSSRPSKPAGHVHRVAKNLHLCRHLGWRGERAPQGQMPNLEADWQAIEMPADERRHWQQSPPILLHPFVSAFGRFKEWPVARYAELVNSLPENAADVVVSWGPGEQEAAKALVAATDGRARLGPATGSPRQLAALLSRSALVVAADTGPLHLAALLGKPVVGLYGPKDPAVYGPWSERGRALRSDVPCSPCTLRRCDHAICMQQLSEEAVAQAIAELLESD